MLTHIELDRMLSAERRKETRNELKEQKALEAAHQQIPEILP